MTTLVAHLEALNANTQAWIDEDPSNRWASMWTTDVAHWAESGIHTVEDFERYELETYIYEGTKDFFHYRRSGLKDLTMEQLREEADRLSKSIEIEIAREKAEQAAAHENFLKRVEEIRELVCGSSFERAVAILADAEDISADELSFYGYESLEYRLGLKYGSIKQLIAERAEA